MTLKCAIVDDEPLALDLMESYVRKTPFLELCGKYNSAVLALEQIRDKDIDLIFLDIQMQELNGLELSRILPHDIRIVFTTAFDQYAIDGFKANAVDYLLKPINYNEFLTAAHKALEWFELKRKAESDSSERDEFIFVKSDYKLIQVRLDDILYIEGLKDYLKIYTENDSRPILTLISMKSMEERLPSPRFMRIHRSYIVQMNKVKTLDKGQVVFGKTRIPISDTYKNDITAYLNKYTL
ncbi:MAG: LytTR family DNA-binding domain-containing protein [Paraprevotella sp.]|nr:LytTR family DNA-binding domain-containing protein [Paraprevotella sp.]